VFRVEMRVMASTPQIGSVPEKPRSIRGPLRYQITTSSPQLEAGTKFSIYTRITNPYDVSVKIKSVTTLLPVEFADVALLERSERKRKIVGLIRSVQEYASYGEGILGGFFRRRFRPSPPSSPRMSTQPVSSVPEADMVSDSDPESIVQLIRTSEDNEAAKADALRQLHQALAKTEQVTESDIELQPGNSVIQVFTLKTNRSMHQAAS
jgi:hypothetical protein